MNLKKLELLKQYKTKLSAAKGYAILRLPHKAQYIQTLKKKYQKEISIHLIKTKLLQKVLDLPKNVLSGKNYLCMLHTLQGYPKLYDLARSIDYYDYYKKNELVIQDSFIKPYVTTLRPGPAYKKIESVLKVKLNKGFIEILQQAVLFYQGTTIDALTYDIIRDLKLDNKPVHSQLLYYKDSTQLTFLQCTSLNEIIYCIKGLNTYIETDILQSTLKQSNLPNLPTLLKDKKNRIYDIPLNLLDLEQGLKLLPDKLVKHLNLPFNGSKSFEPVLEGVLYLFLYDKLGVKSLTYFTNELSFKHFIEQYYPSCKYANNLYAALTSLYETETTKTSSVNSAPVETELDDLF